LHELRHYAVGTGLLLCPGFDAVNPMEKG